MTSSRSGRVRFGLLWTLKHSIGAVLNDGHPHIDGGSNAAVSCTSAKVCSLHTMDGGRAVHSRLCLKRDLGCRRTTAARSIRSIRSSSTAAGSTIRGRFTAAVDADGWTILRPCGAIATGCGDASAAAWSAVLSERSVAAGPETCNRSWDALRVAGNIAARRVAEVRKAGAAICYECIWGW